VLIDRVIEKPPARNRIKGLVARLPQDFDGMAIRAPKCQRIDNRFLNFWIGIIPRDGGREI